MCDIISLLRDYIISDLRVYVSIGIHFLPGNNNNKLCYNIRYKYKYIIILIKIFLVHNIITIAVLLIFQYVLV